MSPSRAYSTGSRVHGGGAMMRIVRKMQLLYLEYFTALSDPPCSKLITSSKGSMAYVCFVHYRGLLIEQWPQIGAGKYSLRIHHAHEDTCAVSAFLNNHVCAMQGLDRHSLVVEDVSPGFRRRLRSSQGITSARPHPQLGVKPGTDRTLLTRATSKEDTNAFSHHGRRSLALAGRSVFWSCIC